MKRKKKERSIFNRLSGNLSIVSVLVIYANFPFFTQIWELLLQWKFTETTLTTQTILTKIRLYIFHLCHILASMCSCCSTPVLKCLTQDCIEKWHFCNSTVCIFCIMVCTSHHRQELRHQKRLLPHSGFEEWYLCIHNSEDTWSENYIDKVVVDYLIIKRG